MKIAILNHSFPPDIGGGESQLYTIASKLHSFGHDIHVFTGNTDREMLFPFKITYLQGFKEFESGQIGFKPILQELKKSIADEYFDIIFCSNFSSLMLISYLRGLIKCDNIVFTFHCGIVPELNKVIGYFNDWDTEKCFASNILLYGQPKSVICPSQHFKEWAIKLGAIENKTHIIYNSVDIDDYISFKPSQDEINKWRQENGISEDSFVFVLPARMYEKKGIMDFLQAIENTDKRAFFYITSSLKKGSEDFAKKAQAFINESNIKDRVRIVYDKNNVNDMKMVYKSCDAFILPSHCEGLPVSIIEAMASKIPVLCSDIEPLKEILIDGYNGFTFRVKNPDDIAATVNKLVDMTDSDRAVIVDNAYQTVAQKFNADLQVKKLENIFKNITNNVCIEIDKKESLKYA